MKKRILLATSIYAILGFGLFADNTAESYGLAPDDYTFNLSKAKEGDGDAMLTIGKCYETGTGVKKDVKQAWIWYGKAAVEGNIEADYIIGTLYRDGIGTKKEL